MNLRAIILLCAVMTGCVHSGNTTRTQQRSIDGLTIYANGRTYAKVILVGQDPQFPTCCRGVAIQYSDSGEYEWISPRKGWQLEKNKIVYDQIQDVNREWGQTHFPDGRVLQNYHGISPDTFGKMEVRCNVSIAKDGTEVIFDEASLFGLKKRRVAIK